MNIIKELPSTITDPLPSTTTKGSKPPSPAYPTYALNNEPQAGREYIYEMAWLLGKALSSETTQFSTEQEKETYAYHIPG